MAQVFPHGAILEVQDDAKGTFKVNRQRLKHCFGSGLDRNKTTITLAGLS